MANRGRTAWIVAASGIGLLAGGALAGIRASDFEVAINEIHYNPAGGAAAANLEYLELWNSGAADVDLSGWAFVEGISYVVPDGLVLPGGSYLVLSPDPPAARSHYRLSRVEGPYDGRLDNGGEPISLVNRSGELVARLNYRDDDPWPSLADGLGPSLEFTALDLASDLPERWAASREVGGSPGRANSRLATAAQGPERYLRGVLNEARPGSGAGVEGFVELHNPTASTLPLGGHWLAIAGSPAAFALPAGASIPPGGFLVTSEAQLGFAVPSATSTIFLLAPDRATLVDVLDVRPSGTGNSFGRFPDGDEDTWVMTSPSRGTPNQYAFDSPIVIHEIQFHPEFVPPTGGCLRSCSDARQWIELWNRSSAEVDLSGWSLTKGIDFDFPSGTKVPAGQGIVVAASVEEFRREHPAVARVVGPWTGRLSNRSDTINLRDALGNRVDRVKYGDGGPRNDLEPEDGIDDGTFRGSAWPTEADGSGRTIELLNPRLENRSGLAWRASVSPGGSPGATNTVFRSRPGPVIDSVRHDPPVPTSIQPVQVTCRAASMRPPVSVTLEWAAGTDAPAPLAMRDDGVAPDAVGGDGTFAATIPAQIDGTVVRFRFRAADGDGETVRLPIDPPVAPYDGFPGASFLYEVDDTPPPENGSPVYRIILSPPDLQELDDRPSASDVLLPGTFIADGEVRYLVGVRYRGESSRRETNRSYRLDFPSESLFGGIEHLNLNGSNGGDLQSSSVLEILASDLLRRAGAPYPQARPVNLRFAGEVARHFDSRYSRKENYDGDFLARFFGGSDGGNLYRGMNPGGPGSDNANLVYLGEDPDPYRALYDKRSNKEEDDYSDIVALTRALDRTQTPDEVFVEEIEKVIDPNEWALFFAAQAILSNVDGGIWNNNGEDYFLYRVPAPPESSRPDAGKFLLLPWDLEESFVSTSERLFRPELQTVRRFLTHPRYASLYHHYLEALSAHAFRRDAMRGAAAFVGRMYEDGDASTLRSSIDSYVAGRNEFLSTSVPRLLVAGAVGDQAAAGVPVIRLGDTWRFFRGDRAPSATDFGWTRRSLDDSTWESGPTGIGYGDGDDATELDDMQGGYTTVFARRRFDIAEPAAVISLVLAVDYDDAFVAWINGSEVARSANAPGSAGDPVRFDDVATEGREAGTAVSFEIAPPPGLLVASGNVLAMAVLNQDVDSSDLSLAPALSVVSASQQVDLTAGCEGTVHVSGPEARLGGTVDPSLARSVLVGGIPAALTFVTSGTGPFEARWEARVPVQPGDNRLVVEVFGLEDGGGPLLQFREITVRRLTGSFTSVSGTLSGDTEWTAAGGPYRVAGQTTVPAGSRLTIRPGTTVVTADRGELIVEGGIQALGTEASPVVFDAARCDAPWAGIRLSDTGVGSGAPEHVFLHCLFAASADPGTGAGILSVQGSRVLVDRCAFRAARSAAITGDLADIDVRDSSFASVRGGVRSTGSSVSVVRSSLVDMIGRNRAVDLTGDGAERSKVVDSLVQGGLAGGLRFRGASVDVVGTTVEGVTDAAIWFTGAGSLGASVVSGCIAAWSATGLRADGGSTISGDHDTIVGCRAGIQLTVGSGGGGGALLDSLILAQNDSDAEVDGSSSLALAYTLLAGGQSWPGTGNISGDPRLEDPIRGDFSLRAGSPCIGAGKDGTDMGAVPYAGGVAFVRGDANSTSTVDISDAVATLNFLFAGGPGSPCQDAMDSDDDGSVQITDAIFTLQFLFLGGTEIPPPYPEPGPDETADELLCEA